jgi:Bacteriophage HK97-gp10, putative tail-component
LGKNESIKIDWGGLEELNQLFEDMDENFEKIAIEEYSKFGLLVEEGAKALVHHDEGDLEDSISFDKAKRVGNDIVVEGGSNSPYAWRRHEEPYRPGIHDKYDDGSKFPRYYLNGRGRRTLTKARWRGYKPGRKYMQNAIRATEPDYDAVNARILERVLNGEGGENT